MELELPRALFSPTFCLQLTKARPNEEELLCGQEMSEEKVEDIRSKILGPGGCACLFGFDGSTGHIGHERK